MSQRSPLDAWLAARMGLPGLGRTAPDESSAPGVTGMTDREAREAREAVAVWQMAELRRTLAWARGASPFHARRLEGIDLASLTAPADLARLPRMTAADLGAPGLLAVSQDHVARVVSLNTSGSSGPPKRLHFSLADLERTLDFFRVGMSTLAGPGDTVLVLLPGQREWGVAHLLAQALPGIGARCVLPQAEKAAAQALPPPFGTQQTWVQQGGAQAIGPRTLLPSQSLPQQIKTQGVTTLVAAPTQLAKLLQTPGAQSLRLRAVLSSGEPLPDDLRRRLETAWGCEVFDHWGMTETGYGGGVECAAHNGYHLREADLLLEVADPETGQPLPVSEHSGHSATGEILLTTLGERALPLVRYRTGDAARWLAGPCPCGSPLRRLGRVPGRLAANGRGIQHLHKGQNQT